MRDCGKAAGYKFSKNAGKKKKAFFAPRLPAAGKRAFLIPEAFPGYSIVIFR